MITLQSLITPARCLLAVAVWTIGIPLALASEPAYPARPVRMVVPSVAGGPADAMARLISSRLTARLGKSFVIDNKPGANLQIGTNFVAKSEADGYTLLTTSPAHIINGLLYPKLPYAPLKDLSGVAMMVRAPLLLVVNADLPIRNVAEFVAWSKAHPGGLRFATSGTGSTAHLAGELFAMHANLQLDHVPYKGTAAALPDLLAGRIEAMIDTVQLFSPLVRSGKLRAIAFTSEERVPAMPDVPTLAESGYREAVASSWLSIVAPTKTPSAVIEQLGAAVAEILTEPEVRAQIAEFGMVPYVLPPAQLNRFFEAENKRWAQVVKAANIRAD